ncbi:dienelactone hydrolase family protein [Sphingomonas immobilis]|uniref:Dienelactone hydrolase family protein n=1 Tax=Sphingomonas immobilis TaxID=3063997 RepID=A0ABT9A471_9SPHN|nr:dienelactone hydrolase family protein [Sphingomonas sp. CA1-15]MDO7844643.1 dienelactone hydrolase family protein [Sphingomonas sp. CA1-15]
MAIVRQTLVYDGPGGPFEGVIAYEDEVQTLRPGVLVVPNVLGQKEADNQKAEALAALGYVGFACDVYGQGKRTTRQSEDAAVYMNALKADRALLRDRLAASLAALKGFDRIDPAKTAAIGFCFGGGCVLDMARSGFDVLGVVSFHGVYDKPDYQSVVPIAPKVLVCHGWDDPLNPPAATTGLAEELTEGGADWQIHAYGNTGHGFTDRDMPPGRKGFGYAEAADRRSWQAMRGFLTELFV